MKEKAQTILCLLLLILGTCVINIKISAGASTPTIVVAGSSNGYVYVYDESGALLWSYNTGADVASVAVSSDGAYIAVGSLGNKLYLFTRSGAWMWEKNVPIAYGGFGNGEESRSVAISAHGEYIVAGCTDNLYVYKTDGTLLWSHAGMETCAGIAAGAGYVVACNGGDGTIDFFSISSSVPLWTKSLGDICSVATSNPGNVIATTSDTAYMFNNVGAQLWSYTLDRPGFVRVDMPDNGLTAVAANDDPGDVACYIWYFNLAGLVWKYTPCPPEHDFYSVSISADGNIISMGPGNIGGVYIYSRYGTALQTMPQSSWVQSVDLTPDGQLGAWGDRTLGTLWFFSKDSGTPLWSRTVGGSVHAVAVAYPSVAPPPTKPAGLLIHIFSSDTNEFTAFATGTGAAAIDFVDTPCNSMLATWQTPPWNNFIQLRDYSDIGVSQIDINNQRWPTGVTEPRVFDPETGTYKHYFGTNEPWDSKAKEFRKAIAYLCDKNNWISTILAFYGHRIDTKVPIGALSGYTDYIALRALGYIYDYDPVKAAQVFDAAGFIQGTTPNPNYSPAVPGSAQFMRTDPRYGGDLQPLIFVINTDDAELTSIGNALTTQLRAAGISVNTISVGRAIYTNRIMILHDYHLFTGGWSLCPDVPDDMHFQFHSSQYFGGSSTGYFGGMAWSPNYVGFCDQVYDAYAEQAHTGANFETVKGGCLKAQERMAELVGIIPAFDRWAVKAFKTGWDGVVNMRGYGTDNRWTFLNAINTVNTPQNPADNVIDWGFHSNLDGLNPVTCGMHPSLCKPEVENQHDWKILDLMYDSLIGRDPYDLSRDFGFAAESWSFNSMDTPYPSATFMLRPGNTFHNGAPVTPEDVKFSLEFQKACGPGVSWAYDEVEPIVRVDTSADDPTLGSRDVKIYFSTPSYWAMHWAGYRPILDHNIWMKANTNLGWGYTRGMTDWNLFTNRMMIREYQPWLYDGDIDGNVDFKEDGSGPWVYQSYAPTGPISAATLMYFTAFSNYIISQNCIASYLSFSFQMLGDLNQDGVVDSLDGQMIQRALGTNSAMLPWGTGWDQYNPACDINTWSWDMIANVPLTQGDGSVNYLDLGKWGLNFGGRP